MEKFEGFPVDKQTWDFPTVINGWVHKLSGAEFKVLWYIVRHTYGWQKTEDSISYRQFMYGIQKNDGTWLDKGTGLSKQSITNALKKLEEYGFIKRVSGKEFGKVSAYSLRFARPTKNGCQEIRKHTSQDRFLKIRNPLPKILEGGVKKLGTQSLTKQSLTRQSLSPPGCQEIRHPSPEMRERLFSLFRKTFPKSQFSEAFLEVNLEKADYLLYLVEKGEVNPKDIKSPRAYLTSLEVEGPFPSFAERFEKKSKGEKTTTEAKEMENQERAKIDPEKGKAKIKNILELLGKRGRIENQG